MSRIEWPIAWHPFSPTSRPQAAELRREIAVPEPSLMRHRKAIICQDARLGVIPNGERGAAQVAQCADEQDNVPRLSAYGGSLLKIWTRRQEVAARLYDIAEDHQRSSYVVLPLEFSR